MSYGLDLGSSHVTLSSFHVDGDGTARYTIHARTPALAAFPQDSPPLVGTAVTRAVRLKHAATLATDIFQRRSGSSEEGGGGGGGARGRSLGARRQPCPQHGTIGHWCFALPDTTGEGERHVEVGEAARLVLNHTLAAGLKVQAAGLKGQAVGEGCVADHLTVTLSGDATPTAASQVPPSLCASLCAC